MVAALVTSALPLHSATAATAPAPAKVSLVATSGDGPAFDLDEHADGDITVQVTDRVAGKIDVDDVQDLTYFWTVKPFGTNAPAVRVPTTGTDLQVDDVAGAFIVPLPAGRGSGTYTLNAGLSANAASANAIGSAAILTVKAGSAAITFNDTSPRLVEAGSGANTVAGALRLEDGTALAGRSIEVGIVRGTDGTDPRADLGFAAVDPTTPLADSMLVTTSSKGAFATTLSDPAEAGQGTELGGTIEAAAVSTPDIGSADTSENLAVDVVSRTAPSGSTVTVSGLGEGTPGQALTGSASVLAPDDTFDTDPDADGVQGDGDNDPDPVEGQVYSLAIDHGFFTTGKGPVPTVVGAPAGDLVSLGTKLNGITDSDGAVGFQAGIARDTAFDDDGRVSATVKATAGSLSNTDAADWDTVEPLNGRVALRLSPKGEQDAPTSPTLAGNRTYYEVFALDQFGNPVGDKPVDLTYSGNLDDWDYSDDFAVSDFDTFGDIWITSFEAGPIKATGTWQDAPTFVYIDTAGGTEADVADASGSTSISFYELRFNSSKFSLTSSASDVVRVGSAVTNTVRVIDQQGNPVRGYTVRFFRFGPDKPRGDAVATRTTNSRGEASYTFVGNRLGRANVTAEITDGTDSVVRRSTAVFGTAIKARLFRGKAGAGADRLTVSAPRVAAGAKVSLYRVTKGKRVNVGTKRVSRLGKTTFKIRDRNRRSYTSYVAVVRSTSKSVADQSNTVKIR